MFYDERIEKTKGEISKRAIFISMIISLVTGIIHCVNLVRNSPGGWYYFLAVISDSSSYLRRSVVMFVADKGR